MIKEKKVHLLVNLLDDKDTFILKEVGKELVTNKNISLPILEKQIFLSKNNLHRQNIQEVIDQIRLQNCKELILKTLKEESDNSYFIFNQHLFNFFKEEDNMPFSLEWFEEFKKQIIKESWLFMNDEYCPEKCLAILHVYFLMTADKNNPAQIKIVTDLTNIFAISKEPVWRVLFEGNSILKKIDLPFKSFLSLLQNNICIRVNPINIKKEASFDDFFCPNLLEKKPIDSLLYLALVQNLLKDFQYNVPLVKLSFIDLEEGDTNTLFIQEYFLLIENEKTPVVVLYDMMKHVFIEAYWVDSEETPHQILYTYSFVEKKQKQFFYRVDFLTSALLIKEQLNRQINLANSKNKNYLKEILNVINR